MSKQYFKYFEVNDNGRLVGPYSGHEWNAGRRSLTAKRVYPTLCVSGWHVWLDERTARRKARNAAWGGRITVVFSAKGYGEHTPTDDSWRNKVAFSQIRLGDVVAVYNNGRTVNGSRKEAILKRLRYK